jgi:hypothetical protein
LADRPDISVIKRGMSIIHGIAAIALLVAANLAVAQALLPGGSQSNLPVRLSRGP